MFQNSDLREASVHPTMKKGHVRGGRCTSYLDLTIVYVFQNDTLYHLNTTGQLVVLKIIIIIWLKSTFTMSMKDTLQEISVGLVRIALSKFCYLQTRWYKFSEFSKVSFFFIAFLWVQIRVKLISNAHLKHLLWARQPTEAMYIWSMLTT